MNKTCARCEKTVYPIEELKCLDKIWHKGCFKCQECGMTLNMKTYKGYGKLPYCEAHVPKAKHTTMAETPELKRIAENTKLQSNVNYHADFEKSKGKFTQVADDPETLRIKANTQIISNVAYHGELAKKAAMEKQRTLNENGELIELPTPDSYDIQIESYATDLLPPSIPPPSIPPPAPYQPLPKQQHYPAPTDYNTSNQQYRNQTHKYDQGHQAYQAHTKYDQTQAKYDQTQAKYDQTQAKYDQTQAKYDQTQAKYDQTQPKYDPTHQAQIKYEQTHQSQKYDPNHQGQKYDPNHQNKKYDPPQQTQNYQDVDYQTEHYQFNQYSAQPNVQISSYPTQPKSVYDEYSGRSRDMIQREQYASQVHAQSYQQQYSQQQQQQRIGKIEDYDPVVDGPRQQSYMPRPSATLIYNSSEQNNGRGHQSQPSGRRPIGSVSDMDPLAAESYRAPAPHAPHAQHAAHAAPPATRGSPVTRKVYVAMYDYEATDSDEVSFREGDLISNVSSIDEGWMTGQVLRTGRTGMLPANYVELAPM